MPHAHARLKLHLPALRVRHAAFRVTLPTDSASDSGVEAHVAATSRHWHHDVAHALGPGVGGLHCATSAQVLACGGGWIEAAR